MTKSISDSSSTVFGACPHDCPDACAMLYDTSDGKLLKVRGNPDHPFTRGSLCIKLKDFEKHHYNEDRILFPLRRSGAKGSGKFKRISWDEALDEIGTKWHGIIDQYGAQAIMPYSYLGNEGILQGLNVGDAFFNRLGASVCERTACGSAHIGGYLMTLGPSIGTDPESFIHARHIIIWACNSVSTNLHHWRIINEARRKHGAKITVIDSFRSRTAEQADWHLAPRPGTDAALAMGIIQSLIEQDLIDEDYVERFTLGYEELKQRAAEFSPDYVESLTGIAKTELQKLARELATIQPAVIRVGIGIERNSQGGQAMRAICSLPALTGAWRQTGGGIMQSPAWAIPMDGAVMSHPEWIPEGTRVINSLTIGAALTEELDPPLKSLMVYNANPATMVPDSRRVKAGLLREDLFTVVSEHFMTDTAACADLVLPATMAAEHEDIIVSWGQLYIALNQKAIEAPGEAIPNTELFRRLAKTMGFNDKHFSLSDEEMMESFIDWDSPYLEGVELETLRQQGFARYQTGGPDNWLPHAQGAFPTPSGKCEFVSSMATHGNFVPPPYRQGYHAMQDGGELDPLPGYSPAARPIAKRKENAAYPYQLLTPKSHAFLNSCYANESAKLRSQGLRTVMIHPQDAADNQISEGMQVRLVNELGAYRAQAHISDGVHQGVVVANSGYWDNNDEHDEGSLNALCSDRFGDIGRSPTYNDNFVSMQRCQ